MFLDCDRIDRSTFVTNLVKIFRTEYNRLPASRANCKYWEILSTVNNKTW